MVTGLGWMEFELLKLDGCSMMDCRRRFIRPLWVWFLMRLMFVLIEMVLLLQLDLLDIFVDMTSLGLA